MTPLLLLFSLLAPAPDLETPRVAPPHGVERWFGQGEGEETIERTGRPGEDRIVARTLEGLLGRVVLVVGVRGEPDEAAVALVRDLLAANADRQVSAVGLVPGDDEARALRALGFEERIGFPGEAANPYLPEGEDFRLSVIGRSGEIVWEGRPGKKLDDLLEACANALYAWPALPLERDLDPALDEAVTDYFGGRWERARKTAQRLVDKAPSEGVHEDATYLLDRLLELEHALLDQAAEEHPAWRAVHLMRLQRALTAGLPGSDALVECERQVENARKALGAGAFFEAGEWAELEADRPVLFPLRKDAAGKRFAKKIRKLIRGSFDTTISRRVKEMLEVFDA